MQSRERIPGDPMRRTTKSRKDLADEDDGMYMDVHQNRESPNQWTNANFPSLRAFVGGLEVLLFLIHSYTPIWMYQQINP